MRTVYLDEQMDVDIVADLRRRGIAVVHAYDVHMEHAEDPDQLTFAALRGWVLASHDSDHDVLHRLGQHHAGLLRVDFTDYRRVAIRIAMLLTWMQDAWEGRRVSWGDLQQRMEKGLRLPGFTSAETRYALGRSEHP